MHFSFFKLLLSSEMVVYKIDSIVLNCKIPQVWSVNTPLQGLNIWAIQPSQHLEKLAYIGVILPFWMIPC